jgi:hypothetical protein
MLEKDANIAVLGTMMLAPDIVGLNLDSRG